MEQLPVAYHSRRAIRPLRSMLWIGRRWLTAALGDRGIPPNSVLEMQFRPHGEAAVTRLCLDLCWATQDGERHARVEVLIRFRDVLGVGSVYVRRPRGDDRRARLEGASFGPISEEPWVACR